MPPLEGKNDPSTTYGKARGMRMHVPELHALMDLEVDTPLLMRELTEPFSSSKRTSIASDACVIRGRDTQEECEPSVRAVPAARVGKRSGRDAQCAALSLT